MFNVYEITGLVETTKSEKINSLLFLTLRQVRDELEKRNYIFNQDDFACVSFAIK